MSPSLTVVSLIVLTVATGGTVTVNVALGVAHWPGSVVNVYTAEAWLLTTAGDQTPLIPFFEVVGNTGTVDPEQITCAVPKSNVGVNIGFTVTLNFTVLIHLPGTFTGVNV